MPKSTEQKWGYHIEESDLEKDNIIAAWGARAIVNWEAGGCYINRETPYQMLGNRQSVTGDTKLCQMIMDIWNKYGLSEAVGKFIVANKDVEYEVLDMYPTVHEDVSNPLDVRVKLAGGYAYIRVGLKKPVEMGKFRSHDEYTAAGNPKAEFIWLDDERPSVGTEGVVSGFSGTVATYVQEGEWQYGMLYSPEAFKHRFKDGTISTDRSPYGHPWACFRSFAAWQFNEQ